jgi:hypothetical protein
MYPLLVSSIELGRNRRAALLLGRGQRRHVIFRVFSGDAARTLDLRMVFRFRFRLAPYRTVAWTQDEMGATGL